MSIDSQLIHTCTVQRATTTRDALNAEVRTWGTVATNVRCRLVIKTQRVGDSAFAERPVVTTHRLLVPAGRTDVQQGDRVITVVDEEGTVDSGPFAILEVMKRRGRAVKHISLLLERTGQDGAAT
jgi:hypothetical protein